MVMSCCFLEAVAFELGLDRRWDLMKRGGETGQGRQLGVSGEMLAWHVQVMNVSM